MAKLEKKLEIYDAAVHNAIIEGPELIIDALDRDQSCLDLQILGEAAAGMPSGMAVLTIKVKKLRR